MNPYIDKLYNLATKSERIIIGLMSGTSLDGLDIAVCKISGHGRDTYCEVSHFATIAYDKATKSKILNVFAKEQVDLKYLTLLNPWIGELHAKCINEQLQSWNIDSKDIDLIASHGQTIYHCPNSFHEYHDFNNATLQIGDGDHIAVNTGIITLSDFRQKHIAAGYEGAPLAQYGDYCLFANEKRHTLLLNIGGIANFTLIKKSSLGNDLICSDIGPGNTIMDQYVRKHLNLEYDEDGRFAASGRVSEPLLQALLELDFVSQPMPKTTGPELFNLSLIESTLDALGLGQLAHQDVLATLNKFTALCIVKHVEILGIDSELDILVSGGGAYNAFLITSIRNLLVSDINITVVDQNGICAESKEAVLFAILANEAVMNGDRNTDSSSLTMGKISLPL
ncbi:anhydro-N-acetylmuramic acid kinase [Pseudoalteromonas luteoviolacea]|uniref:anhydro-N-acetylmuramic acid kinase n=1 Tax=Pseudoalteromonas luteoviolacea TaxID=43657 RepID=UPI001B395A72|nr:anhydro-N-acetylmuramic acid kinase [Pseudoalteromonas luteoviolacea]MBQ4835285.1 anhydro-N-acetylmuramic acid kinase [Pseudoalteromonas luteoviolacea]